MEGRRKEGRHVLETKYKQNMSFKRLQFFPFISFFCFETLFAVYSENFLDEILL